MKKRINVKSVSRTDGNAFYVDGISKADALLHLLDTEDGWEKLQDADEFKISAIGLDVPMYVCPETWDILQTALATMICFYIEVSDLYQFPYYKATFDRYAKTLGKGVGDFMY